jgi:hypothetical protein
MTMRLLAFVCVGVFASASAQAAGKASVCPKGDYEDTKSRFCVHQEPGWSLAPIPGDTSGMVFRKTIEGVPASLRVMVRAQRSGETTKQALDEVEDAFKTEIGYKAGGDVPSSIGLLPAVRRTFSVYASGDKNTVRAIEVYALFAFGHAHIIHFETLEKKRGAFTRDLDRMLASYKALAGKGTYAPLAGTWINTGGGPDLTLEEDGHFKMGPLSGGYQADAGAIVLTVKEGGEKYRYQVSGNTLTLSSPNLGGDLVFKRSGAQRVKMDEPDKPKVTGPLTREQLIGTWKVLDKESTDPLKLQLAASGSCAFGPLSGRWRYSTGRLTITSTQNVTITYSASMEDGKLVLGGGDLESELAFIRE